MRQDGKHGERNLRRPCSCRTCTIRSGKLFLRKRSRLLELIGSLAVAVRSQGARLLLANRVMDRFASVVRRTARASAARVYRAAKIRGLKRKKQMLESSGGALASERVAEVLGISRQAVDKRRSSNQLLALTQGKRGYSYPSFQFHDGKTITGLEQVLAQMKTVDPWMQMVFFTSPNERLDHKTPIACLQKGLVEEVTRAASGFGEQGAL